MASDQRPASKTGSASSTRGARVRDRLVRPLALGAEKLSRGLRMGSGTSLPGRIMERLSPGYIERRVRDLPQGVVVVSGTNGKTTTAAMLQEILRSSGARVLANESGANLTGGVATALLTGDPRAEIAVFEVDEAVLPGAVPMLRPHMVVLTNVFRDQLDRFTEPERTAALLRQAVLQLPDGAVVVANADDPHLWAAIEDRSPIAFSVEETPSGTDEIGEGGADAEPALCPRCGQQLSFATRSIGGLGRARCDGCEWASGAPDYAATVRASSGLDGIVFGVKNDVISLPIGGVHNVYNAVAALAAARTLGVPTRDCVAALESFEPRFGRAELVDFEGRRLWLGLIKNPAGASALCRDVAQDASVGAVVVSVNDLDADGHDVSWIWDANFESLVAGGKPLVPSGRRAEDVALRIKYAGGSATAAERDPVKALRRAARACPRRRLLAVLATYTAMLGVREALMGRVARVQGAPT